jgi:hypothetical protein
MILPRLLKQYNCWYVISTHFQSLYWEGDAFSWESVRSYNTMVGK